MNQDQQTPNADQQQQQAAPQPPSTEEIARAVAQEMQQFQQQQVQQRSIDDMTDAERAEYLQIFDPAQNEFDQRFAAALANEEDPTQRLKILGEFRDGIMNQATRAAEIMLEQRMVQMQQQMSPAIKFAQQQQSEALWSDFATKFPAFKEQRQLVDTVSMQLASTGYQPKTKDELFSKVAEMTTSILKNAGVTLPTQGSQAPTQMPGMSQQRVVANGPGSQGAQQAPDGARIAPFLLKRTR